MTSMREVFYFMSGVRLTSLLAFVTNNLDIPGALDLRNRLVLFQHLVEERRAPTDPEVIHAILSDFKQEIDNLIAVQQPT
jgi:hypothetical protein